MFCALQGNKGLHLLRHSDCRTVGRVVAPDSRDPRFESICRLWSIVSPFQTNRKEKKNGLVN